MKIRIDNTGLINQEDIKSAENLIRIYHAMAEKNEVKFCPFCNQSVSKYKMILRKMTVDKLATVFRRFKGAATEEVSFSPKDVGASEDTNFAQLIHFGLLYRPRDGQGKKMHGLYGMNRRYVAEFFGGKRTVPAYIWKNPVTGEKVPSEERVTIQEIPSIREVIGIFGDIATEFQEQEMPDLKLGQPLSLFSFSHA